MVFINKLITWFNSLKKRECKDWIFNQVQKNKYRKQFKKWVQKTTEKIRVQKNNPKKQIQKTTRKNNIKNSTRKNNLKSGCRK